MLESVIFNGVLIKSESTAVHLGSVIGYGADKKRIDKAISDVVVQTNTICSLFSKTCIDVKYKLFKSYCMSLYGSPLWDLTAKNVSNMYTTWRKCIRRLYCLPYRTHCYLLPLICCDVPVQVQLCKRFSKFMYGAINSSNECVKTCAVSALYGSCSSAGNNVNLLASMLSVSKYSLFKDGLHSIANALDNTFMPDDSCFMYAQMVRDLLTLSSEGYPNFDKSDFLEMMNYICCL